MKIINQIDNLLLNKNQTLREGLQLLDQNGMQILLVTDGGRALCGTVTDGDIRRHILGNKSLDVQLCEIMNINFSFLSVEHEYEAEDVLRAAKFNHLPIIDQDGCVVRLVISFDHDNTTRFKSDIPVVIMAGGKGTRLSPLTKIIPKPLVPVGDVTMIEKIMENFSEAGFHRFIIVVNHKKELIKSYLNEVGLPYEISFVDEEEYFGTVGGLRLIRDKLSGSQFVLSNCDIVAMLNYASLLDWHKNHNAKMTILGVQKRIDIPYGVVKIDDGKYVNNVHEKPYMSHVIMSGIYVLDSSILDYIPEDGSYDMDKLIEKLLSSGEAVTCFPIEDGWFDMGQLEEYKNLLSHFGVIA